MDTDRTHTGDQRLVRLEELKGFQIADESTDIRGWDVRTADGKKIGKVDELIVDPAERRVRYMEVKVEKDAIGADDDRHVLVPIGTARLNEKGNDVLIERLPARGLTGVPAYKRGPITREYETSLREYYGAAAVSDSSDYYRDDMYDDRGFRKHTDTSHTRETSGRDASTMPRLGDNEVTVPLGENQEVIVRRPGSDEEIVIRKNTERTSEDLRDR